MVDADIQRNEFQGRLERIRKGGPNTLGHTYVGPVEEDVRRAVATHFGPLPSAIAFAFGLAGYFIGNLAQFHLAGDLERLGPQALEIALNWGDLIVAVLVLLIFVRLTRMGGRGPLIAGAVGLAVMMGLHTTTVQFAPELYSTLYSPDYVAEHMVGPETAAF